MKKVLIIHGWEGNPENNWFPWLKKELENKNITVIIPSMPNPGSPEINSWISHLKKEVKTPDKETYFIGHSIGCQTILRYLEKLPEKIRVGGVVMVGGWVTLTPEATEDEKSKKIATPWIETPINWEKIKLHTHKFTAIFSDNDPFIPLENSKTFKEKLNAKAIIEKNKGHFDDEAGIKKAPYILKAIMKMIE